MTVTNEVEYKALRDEILKRIELRYQIIGVNLTILAAIFAFSLGTNSKPELLLIHPLIAMLLAFPCISNELSIRYLVDYIKTDLEPKLGFGWEKWVAGKRNTNASIKTEKIQSPLVWDMFVLLITQAIAVSIGLYLFGNFAWSPLSLKPLLLYMDLISMLVVIIILGWWFFWKEIFTTYDS